MLKQKNRHSDLRMIANAIAIVRENCVFVQANMQRPWWTLLVLWTNTVSPGEPLRFGWLHTFLGARWMADVVFCGAL